MFNLYTHKLTTQRRIMTNNAKSWTTDLSSIVEKYAEQIMDSMDMKTMEQFVFDTLCQQYSSYSEDELINEIKETYPALLEDN